MVRGQNRKQTDNQAQNGWVEMQDDADIDAAEVECFIMQPLCSLTLKLIIVKGSVILGSLWNHFHGAMKRDHKFEDVQLQRGEQTRSLQAPHLCWTITAQGYTIYYSDTVNWTLRWLVGERHQAVSFDLFSVLCVRDIEMKVNVNQRSLLLLIENSLLRKDTLWKEKTDDLSGKCLCHHGITNIKQMWQLKTNHEPPFSEGGSAIQPTRRPLTKVSHV